MAETPNGPSGILADGHLRRRASGATSVTESEDQVRNLKASQSVEAAFQAAGIPSPPGDIAAIITNHVKSDIQTLPLNQVANMSPGSGPLATSAIAAVNQFVSSLTPSQREAVKAGVNPLDASAMMKLSGLFKSDASNFGRMSGRDGTDSSARFDGMGSQGFTQTQLQARDLATKLGMGWATNNPDLLRLGPSAIQALADVHLQKDSFQRFKNVGLDEKTIVAGAKYAKRNHVDYNDASKKIEETDKELSPEGKATHRKAIEELFNCKPGEEAAAKKKFNETTEEGLKSESPKAHEKLKDEQKTLQTKKAEEHAAVKKADVKEAKNDDLAAKGADLLKKRQAAAQSPKPST